MESDYRRCLLGGAHRCSNSYTEPGGVLSLQPNMQNKLKKCATPAICIFLTEVRFSLFFVFIYAVAVVVALVVVVVVVASVLLSLSMRVMPPFGICHVWHVCNATWTHAATSISLLASLTLLFSGTF